MSEKKSSPSAISAFFVFFILSSILFAGFNNTMKEITDASFEAAKGAVNLSIGLIGIMALWLGLVRILEAGGLMYTLAKKLKPVMTRLFPDVPAEHPAMSSMILNISANMLGLGNAATPMGIKAMEELNRLNPFKGQATNAMCLFLAVNTSSIALLPLGVIGVRAAAGSQDPAAIFLPSLLATTCSTIVAITISLLLAKRDSNYREEVAKAEADAPVEKSVEESKNEFAEFCQQPMLSGRMLAVVSLVTFFLALGYQLLHAERPVEFLTTTFFSYWLMPFLMLLILCYGLYNGVKMYEAVTDGAKQGFQIAVRIIPFLVAILVAIAMFRASGAMEVFIDLVSPLTSLIGLPAELLPMAIIRPLSGSGAFALMSASVQAAPDSFNSYLASVMMGSTETTFYVLAVYFGSVGITRVRHALVAALCADMTGIIAACAFSHLFWN